MANPTTPATPEAKLLMAVRRSAAASLAGGIIAASGRPHTVDEAVRVFEDVQKAMVGGRKKARQGAR